LSRVRRRGARTVLRGPRRGNAPGLPDSAMTSWALMVPVPCTASSCPIWCRYGAASTSILAVRFSIWAVKESMAASIIAKMAVCASVRKEQSRASSSRVILRRMVPRASWASAVGLRCPAMIASSMALPDTPWMPEITDDSFRCASSSSFSTRCFSAVRAWVRWRR
jgi:hypothetical protein